MTTQYEHTAKYYETDQMGIIHHSNYIRWMEEARIDFMNKMGFSYKAMEEMGIISPVLEVTGKYKNMVHFDDTVIIDTGIKEYNGVKMTISYEMKKKEDGAVCFIGESKHCFMSSDGKIVSLSRKYPEVDLLFKESM